MNAKDLHGKIAIPIGVIAVVLSIGAVIIARWAGDYVGAERALHWATFNAAVLVFNVWLNRGLK